MRLSRSGREPDLLFVASAHREHLRATYLDGPAELVIQVVSPESAARDRGDKFYEYEAATVAEYWLLDPEAERAEFYQLDEHGKYRQVALNAQGIYRSRALPGFWLDTSWLWSDSLPRVMETLRAIAGESSARGRRHQLGDATKAPDATQ
jgi:Uma2 family endonuclease